MDIELIEPAGSSIRWTPGGTPVCEDDVLIFTCGLLTDDMILLLACDWANEWVVI